MTNGRQGGHFTTSVSGGTYYILVGIGVGIAAAGSASLPMAIISGAFWPATLGYWAVRALQQYAAGG